MAKVDVVAIEKKSRDPGRHASMPLDIAAASDVVKATLNLDKVDKQAEPGAEEEIRVMVQVSEDGFEWRDAFGFGWKPYGPGGLEGEFPDPCAWSDMSAHRGKKIRVVKTVLNSARNSGVTVNL